MTPGFAKSPDAPNVPMPDERTMTYIVSTESAKTDRNISIPRGTKYFFMV